MTNNEAAKWIQLYIDLAKIDPTTGEDAYLNEDDRKTLEAMGMARDALACNRLATNLQPCKQDDLIRRSDALGCYHDWIDRYGDVHTPDEMAEYRAIEELPSVEPKHTEKRTETRACDLISRQVVINTVRTIILGFFSNEDGAMTDTEKTLLSVNKSICDGVRELPSAQPTLYGYNIEHLELIARILQKEDLPPERIVEALTDIGRIVEIVKDEYEEALRKAVEQCMI